MADYVGGSDWYQQYWQDQAAQAAAALGRARLEYDKWRTEYIDRYSVETDRAYKEATIRLQEAEQKWNQTKYYSDLAWNKEQYGKTAASTKQQFDVSTQMGTWNSQNQNAAQNAQITGRLAMVNPQPNLPYTYQREILIADFKAKYGREPTDAEIEALLPWYTTAAPNKGSPVAPGTTPTTSPGTTGEPGEKTPGPTVVPNDSEYWEPDQGWPEVTAAFVQLINKEWQDANFKWEPDPKWGWPKNWRDSLNRWLEEGGVPSYIPKEQLDAIKGKNGESWWQLMGAKSRKDDWANWQAPADWQDKWRKMRDVYKDKGQADVWEPDDPNWKPPADWNWPPDWKERMAKGAVRTGKANKSPSTTAAAGNASTEPTDWGILPGAGGKWNLPGTPGYVPPGPESTTPATGGVTDPYVGGGKSSATKAPTQEWQYSMGAATTTGKTPSDDEAMAAFKKYYGQFDVSPGASGPPAATGAPPANDPEAMAAFNKYYGSQNTTPPANTTTTFPGTADLNQWQSWKTALTGRGGY